MRQIELSTLANQNISTDLLVHTYTADAERSIFVRVFLDQVIGSGDYTVYAKVQRLGVGSFYRFTPITIAAVATGVTSISFTTIPVPMYTGDVMTIYVKGLAGDTTTPDIITEVWEDNYSKAGDKVDIVDSPNALAVSVIQSGLSTLSQTDIIADAIPFSGGFIDTPISSRSTLVQSDILSDSTPFNGAYIDAAISTITSAILTRLASVSEITVVNPVSVVGNVTTYMGDDYYDIDERALSFADPGGIWPTLSGATVNAVINAVGTFACTVITDDLIICELSSAQTNTIPTRNFPHPFQVIATLPNGHIVTIIDGHWTSKVKRTV